LVDSSLRAGEKATDAAVSPDDSVGRRFKATCIDLTHLDIAPFVDMCSFSSHVIS
jgi:hypothetical protein